MDAFKGTVEDKQFYFKTKDEGNSYLVEPYRQTGVKSFRIIKRKADSDNKNEWQIPAEENVPDGIRNMETGFSDLIRERKAVTL